MAHGAKAVEAEQFENAQRKRVARKDKPASTDIPAPILKCSTCGRSFRARIGLISHLRTHQNRQTPTAEAVVLVDHDGRTSANLLSVLKRL